MRLVVLVLTLGLVATGSAGAAGPTIRAHAGAASVSALPAAGPPTSRATVSGSGFQPGETVDLFLDTTHLAAVTADAGGAFAGATIRIPAAALPGEHWLSAVGRTSRLSAQTQFLVRTNWPSFRDNPALTGFNAVENVLSPASVGGLTETWNAATGGPVYGTSSPVVAGGLVYVAAQVRVQHQRPGLVSAFDAVSGAPRWSRHTDGYLGWSAPVFANGVLYVG